MQVHPFHFLLFHFSLLKMNWRKRECYWRFQGSWRGLWDRFGKCLLAVFLLEKLMIWIEVLPGGKGKRCEDWCCACSATFNGNWTTSLVSFGARRRISLRGLNITSVTGLFLKTGIIFCKRENMNCWWRSEECGLRLGDDEGGIFLRAGCRCAIEAVQVEKGKEKLQLEKE